MIRRGTFTIGTDTELFLQRKVDNKFISAIPFIDGTKHHPKILKSKTGNIQRDNVAVEFATNPAVAKSRKKKGNFVDIIKTTLSDVAEYIPKDCDLSMIASTDFNKSELEDEEAKIFGCDPDFNAWTVSMNNADHPEDLTFRSCGGHIHVGFVKDSGNDFLLDFKGKLATIKMMDCFHGVISVLLDRSESSARRKELYGKAGAHRPKDYGVEYRVLSNYWLKSPELVMLMENLTNDVLKLIRNKKHTYILKMIGDGVVVNTINNNNIKDAQIILDNIYKHLSKNSLFYLDMALEKVDNYNFKKEWKLMGA